MTSTSPQRSVLITKIIILEGSIIIRAHTAAASLYRQHPGLKMKPQTTAPCRLPFTPCELMENPASGDTLARLINPERPEVLKT